MSSVIAFIRALVMLASVLVVLVLVMSHGDAVSRAKEAASRCLSQLSTDRTAAGSGGSASHQTPPSGTSPPPPAEAFSEPSIAGADRPLGPLPEPVEDAASAPTFPVSFASRSASVKLERATPVALVHSPQPVHEAEGSSVADWEDRASLLQELGAVEYALEKWGDEGELYRFRCQLAVAGSRSYRKHFQAVDADGGRAVERVLKQVANWRQRLSGGE